MCKSEYKLIRKMQWGGDVLKVQDIMHDVLREAKQSMTDAMTGEVLNHFECDLSDYREYMHDKIKWERKRELAMPHWIPVTEQYPEKLKPVLVWQPKYTNLYIGLWDGTDWWLYGGMGIKEFGITHWKSLSEPPKETDGDEQTVEDI